LMRANSWMPSNGNLLVSISYTTSPKLYTSHAAA
jgi:hypothetical protein